MKIKMDQNPNVPKKNPYKALASYEETDQDVFYGREKETKNLYQLVRLNPLVVVMGKSGIGKTSLLNAGLFPLLRKEGFLPIRMRLQYKDDGYPLLEQIRRSITGELDKYDIKIKSQSKNEPAEPLTDNETLWDYFHRVHHFDPSDDSKRTPVLMFDQFEEFFTLGKNHRDRKKLIDELYWLLEDQFPETAKKQIKNESKFLKGYPEFRVVISLREDYLPHITELKPRIPSIDRVMFRVTHINGSQAREIIGMPGGFTEKKEIDSILRFFFPEEIRNDHKKSVPDKELEIDPVFLSLLCYKLFEKQSIEPFTSETQQKIFEEFYDSKMAELGESNDKEKVFIESKLLDDEGFRTPFYLEAKHKFRDSIDRLVDLRILRKFHDGEREHVEISHDILAPIIKQKRENRLLEEKRKESWKKTFRKYVYSAAALLLIITVFALVQTFSAINQTRIARVNWLTAEALVEFPLDNTKAMRIAEAAYEKGLPNPPARTYQVLSNIAYSSYDRPFYCAILRHDGSIYSAVFSPDGKHVLTASEDGAAKLWNIDGVLLNDKIKHEEKIMSAVFSPDSKQILTASWDKTAKLWDLEGNLITDLNLHNGAVTSALFSPDGDHILTASRDGTAKLWNLKGEVLADFNHKAAVSSAVFSPNGETILTASWDKSVKLWNQKDKLLTEFQHDRAVESAVFSPDGKHILTASWDHNARLWNLDAKVLKEFKHEKAVTSALFSRDGSLILTASLDGTAKLWNRDSGEPLAVFNHDVEVISAKFSPDGKQVLTASKNGATKLWNLDGTLQASFKNHEGEISAADFSPDGNKIITASLDGTAKVWELKSNLLVNLKHKDEVTSVTFSPDSKRILTALRDHTARVWDLEGNLLRELNQHTGVIYSASFSPDGNRILTASNDGTAKIWNSRGDFLFNLMHNGPVTSAMFSPDGSQILTASLDQSAKLWGLQGNLIKIFPTPNRAILSAIFSPTGNWILTTSADGIVKVWDIKGKDLAELPHNRSVASAVFSPDGKQILTAATDGIARLWNAKGKLLSDNFKHNNRLSSAVFSPDGSKILTASYDDYAKIWTLNGKLIEVLKHDSAILSALFSPNGKQIITASEDGSAKLWDTGGRLLANLDKHKRVVNSAIFSPDARRIVTASKDGIAKVFLTPDAIYQWLKTANIAALSEGDRKNLESQR